MLLQDFFVSARPYRVRKKKKKKKAEDFSTFFVLIKIKYKCRSKENHFYRKTVLSMIDYVYLT